MKLFQKLLPYFFIAICIGCSQSEKGHNVSSSDTVNKIVAINTVQKIVSSADKATSAKEWLLASIARYLKAEPGKENDTTIFTKQYLEYKADAIGRDFDEMTQKQFENKWKSKFNTKYATTNSILIGQQDTVDPKVTKCELKKRDGNKSFVFNIILEDADNEGKYTHVRDIKVKPVGNSFIIEDILEYD